MSLVVLATLFSSLLVQQVNAVATDAKPTEPTVADPWNSRLSVDVGADGRYSVGAFPDPSTGDPTTDSFKLLYGWPNTGTTYSTLHIDGADAILGQDAPVTAGPTDSGDTDTTTFAYGAVTTTQTLSLVTNPQTGQSDAVRIAYRVSNSDAVSHEIGARAMLDTDVNDNDGAPFRIPGIGAVTTEQDLSGSAVPDTFQVFQDLSDSSHIASATLRGAEATPPDRLVVAAWPSIYGSPWDYTTTPGQPITGDSAYAAYWSPQALSPGSSRTYVTYYGLANVTVDLSPPIALGLTGPASLAIAGSNYSPNPFSVVATVSDDGTAPVEGATIVLNLPAGLHTSDPTTVNLGTLSPGEPEQLITWHVTADPQASATTFTYSVTASGTNTDSKTLSRQIAVPALASPPTYKCGTYHFFGVRGSGESADLSQYDGMGEAVWSTKVALSTRIPGIESEAVIGTFPDDYPAIKVYPFSLSYYTADYQNSEYKGVVQLQRQLKNFFSKCKTTYAVIAGYSQGADVVGDVYGTIFSTLTDRERKHIGAVIMFGDPRFVYNKKLAKMDYGDFDPSLHGAFLFASSTQDRQNPHGIDRNLVDNVYDTCIKSATGVTFDPVCNSNPPNVLSCAGDPPDPVFCAHLQYPLKETDNAALWAAVHLKKLPRLK